MYLLIRIFVLMISNITLRLSLSIYTEN